MEGDSRFESNSPIEAPGSLVPAALAGLAAALVAGAAWAAIVWATNFEIGYAAVGVGALVGFAMSRASLRRDRSIGVLAALLAFAGLLAARVFIAEVVIPNQSVGEVLEDPELMGQAAMMELAQTSHFPPELQARYDSVADDEEIPEALVAEMRTEAEGYLRGIDETERQRLARNLANAFTSNLGITGLIVTQLGVLDILWVFLAVSTAWKMMSGDAKGSPSGPQQVAP